VKRLRRTAHYSLGGLAGGMLVGSSDVISQDPPFREVVTLVGVFPAHILLPCLGTR